jgi:hypothetical protein
VNCIYGAEKMYMHVTVRVRPNQTVFLSFSTGLYLLVKKEPLEPVSKGL